MNVFKLWRGIGAQHGEKYMAMLKRLENMTAVGESGAGMVKATMNANGKLIKVEIDDQLVGKDKRIIEDLIVTACNNARDASLQVAAEEMKNMQSGMPDLKEMVQGFIDEMNKSK
jgi:DNA-binding YbaB/EbfC family protein